MSALAAKTPSDFYLDLLKKSILGMIYEDTPIGAPPVGSMPTTQYIKKFRELGRDCPSQGQSMIGLKRMNNIQSCMEQIHADGVPGDVIETGVWRGGATIFIRGFLAAHAITDRTVWVADSFQGLPPLDQEKFPISATIEEINGILAVPLEEVQRNFALYGLLDEQVRFLVGWFSDTLPTAPIAQLALLRLDGDLYRSTWDALSALYPKVAPGGFIIIDDFNFSYCRQAVINFRKQFGIHEPIVNIDDFGAFWRRSFEV